MTVYLLTTSHFENKFPTIISFDNNDGYPTRLITYNIFNVLSVYKCEIEKFNDILDIYLLESILYLGKHHRRYFSNEKDIPNYGYRKFISEDRWLPPDGQIELSKIPTDFFEKITNYTLKLKRQCSEEGIWRHYTNIELPFALNLYWLTRKGITLDLNIITFIERRLSSAKQKIEYALDINNVSGSKVQDLNDWINGYGFNEFFPFGRDEISIKDLSLLEDKHQVFKIFLRSNKLKRIKSFLKNIGHQQKIYPSYRTIGAVTGRCTSAKPNIMGVPKIFRSIVIPSRDDFGIVECDYSQMEVGVAAGLSNDKNLIYDFNNKDVYKELGFLLFGNHSYETRSKGKIIFLGIQYGLSRKTIARRLYLSEGETLKVLDRFYGRYSALKEYLSSLENDGLANGFVKNISGLKRYRRYPERIPDYWERNWFKNFPIQSSAASVFKSAIIRIYQQLKYESFHLLVPFYDSIVFECPIDRIKEITGVIVNCMTRSMKEYFPVLNPKVTVNDSDPTCWSSDGKINILHKFLNNPLFDIDIKDKPKSNVDWDEYF